MKKFKPYLYTGLISLGILSIVFIMKGIFPFGDNSLIWGDMHDQITAFYYHFYDSFHGNNSLLINFSTGGAINFLGILAYYILSPFSLLILIIPREYIYLMVSVIIALKIITCSITCLYFLRTYFKKLPSSLSMLLAVIYAFSGYGLVMYQITPWIDAMYMFPLILIGLKKVLDLEKPTFYIITLTLSLIFSFYVSIMVIIFIFLASFIYLLVYKEDINERKKAIVSLGIATVLSLLIASFIVVPSYLEISESSRIGFKLKVLLNSKTGPLSDKLSMLAFGGVVYAGLLILAKNFKEHKKFLSFYIPVLLIVLIPLLIEPINKVWHFGSYASFPYRSGFILMLLLITGAAYSFENYKESQPLMLEINKIASIFVAVASSILMARIIYKYYDRFQSAIYRLSISFDSKLIVFLLLVTLIATLGSIILLALNKKLSSFTIFLLFVVTVVHITSNCMIYLGNDKHQESLTAQYRLLNKINKDYPKNEYYRIKSNLDETVTNNGMVTKYHNTDHFTSLTNKNTLNTFKKLGYGTQWVKTYSRGGTLFMDAILGNKYYLSNAKYNNPYYEFVKSYDNANLYKLRSNVPYGVLINKNDTVIDKNNSFEIANSLYKNILNTDEELFVIDDTISLDNVKAKLLDKGLIEYSIIDDDYYAYIEKDVIITGRKNLYLEINHQLANDQNFRINEAFNLYVNDKLVMENAFIEPYNGTMDLGIYENQRVNIKLELKKSVILKKVTVGVMDLSKYESFMNVVSKDNQIKFNKNTISATVDGEKGKILLLPINYDRGYKATVNNRLVKIQQVYDNFIGIPLDDGINNISIKYTPNGFIPTLIISAVSIIVAVLLIKFNVITKLGNIEVIRNIFYYIYLFLYLAFIVIIYIGLTLCFLLSYFVYFKV